MKNYIFSVLVFLIPLFSFSQKGNIEIIKDPRIDQLIKQEGGGGGTGNGNGTIILGLPPQITGYRIQLFFDGNKSKVDEARSKFISMYPKIDTYVYYNAPNYFLKVGNFRTQIEAEKIKSTLESQFPTSFVIKEKVNLPKID